MKKYNHLTHEQRYTISVCLKENKTKSEIARLIGVSKSTVSREIKRNSNSVGRYVLKDAEMFASMSSARSHRPRKLLDFDTPKYKFMLYLHNCVALGC
ncbi:MAG: helix-turn-helix domain-containing protein [Bacteroidales bacterium]|nr:helix-turn-helix domain-containing protein [Bacteroidales bacterium]